MKKKDFLDKPKNIKRLLVFFYAFLVFLLILDFFIEKHVHFSWEQWPEFSAVFGFVACVILVLVSKYLLRPLVKRQEDYYD